VYTIGFGTANGSVPFADPNGGFGGGFGGGGFGGGRFRTGIDEATLKQIAKMTGGEYYTASSASELQKVFANLPTYLIAKHAVTEISVVFTAIGTLLAITAMLLALAWHPLA
jgi:Ca-activated chloride channel family protein